MDANGQIALVDDLLPEILRIKKYLDENKISMPINIDIDEQNVYINSPHILDKKHRALKLFRQKKIQRLWSRTSSLAHMDIL